MRNIPYEEAKGLPPSNAVSSYNLVLTGFGLAYLKPKLYQSSPGWDQDDSLQFREQGKLVFGNIKFVDTENDTDSIIINAVLMDVSQDKNVIVTNIQGRDGSVKEYISDSDYNIVFRGVIVSSGSNTYPTADVDKLLNICKKKKSIPVISPFLQMFGISNIVIIGDAFPQKEGFNNTQLFEIRALSDDPINIRIKKDGKS